MEHGIWRFRFCILPAAALGVILAWAAGSSAQQSPKSPGVGDDELYAAVPPDQIQPITRPTFVPRADAEAWMIDDEPVLGIVDPATGQAKAYSLWYLDRHEIVNDRLGGKAIAATW